MTHMVMVATTVMAVAMATILHIMQSTATQCHLSIVQPQQQQLKQQARGQQPSKQHQLWQAMSSRLPTNLLLRRQQQVQQRRHLPLLLLLQMLQAQLSAHQLMTSSSSSSSRKPQMLTMHSRSSSSSSLR
jgi:hypothetical protein